MIGMLMMPSNRSLMLDVQVSQDTVDRLPEGFVYEKFLGDLPDLGSRRDQRIQGFKILDGHLNLARSMSG